LLVSYVFCWQYWLRQYPAAAAAITATLLSLPMVSSWLNRLSTDSYIIAIDALAAGVVGLFALNTLIVAGQYFVIFAIVYVQTLLVLVMNVQIFLLLICLLSVLLVGYVYL
jgi:hypothetical protein